MVRSIARSAAVIAVLAMAACAAPKPPTISESEAALNQATAAAYRRAAGAVKAGRLSPQERAQIASLASQASTAADMADTSLEALQRSLDELGGLLDAKGAPQ